MERYVPTTVPFSSKKLRAKVVVSYIFDYVILVVLIAAFYLLDAIEPFHQPFSLKNYTLMYPYADPERVPIGLALAIVGLGPAAIIAVYTLVIDGVFATGGGGYKKYTLKSRLWELNCGILGLLLGLGASFVITGALKNAIGKPRPDVIARCNVNATFTAPFLQTDNFTLFKHDFCNQPDNAILKDGFRSFPSGHSSSAFSGLFYLTLYLCGKLHVLDSRGEVWKTFIVLIPSLGAALIAGSRIMDARHHPFDVISGSLLGIVTAWIAYRQYFPPLHDFKAKGRAYPIRTWGQLREERNADMDMARLPLKSDPGYAAREESPQRGTHNVFRSEMNAPDRRQTSSVEPPPTSIPPPPQYGVMSNPYAPSRRRDEWDDSSEEGNDRDVELQRLGAQNTAYSSYKPAPSQAQGQSAGAASGGGVSAASSQPRGVQLTESYGPR